MLIGMHVVEGKLRNVRHCGRSINSKARWNIGYCEL